MKKKVRRCSHQIIYMVHYPAPGYGDNFTPILDKKMSKTTLINQTCKYLP